MSPRPARVRDRLKGAAALLCPLLAGWSLVCAQSDQPLAAEILAVAAAGIPAAALLARLAGAVGRARGRE